MSFAFFNVLGALVFSGLSFWILWPLGLVRLQEGGWGAGSIGMFASITWLACLALLPFAQGAVARLGHRLVVAFSHTVLVAAAAGYLLAFEGWLVWLWAALLGFAFGLRWPALDAWAVELTSIQARGRMLALLETVAGLTMVAGPAVGALMGIGDPAKLGVAALAAAALAGVLGLLTPSPVDERVASGHTRASASRLSVIAIIILAAAFCGGLFESGFMAAGPLIARAEGLSTEAGLWVAVLVGAGSVVVQMLIGWSADRYGAVRVLSVCAAGLALAFGALGALPGGGLMQLSAVIGGLGGALYTLAAIHGVQTNGARTAGAIGLAAAAYTIGSLVSPALAGTTIDSVGPVGAVLAMGLISAALWAAISWSGARVISGSRSRP